MEKDIFEKEQEHLTKIYGKLSEKQKSLEEEIASLDAKAIDDKNDIRDNIRFDYADSEAAMETLAEIEVWNRYIDTYNVQSDSLGKSLETVNKLLQSPYFARIDLQFEPGEDPESYYIGRASFAENGHRQLIVDWRAPIAEVYYNQEMGHTSYTVEDREISVDLKKRRQFDLEKDKLISYFDTQIAIEDPILLQSLSHEKSDKMSAITETIQKEQNRVIRYPDVPCLLVNGIAGSGKTSVLLQRIAYLFYQKRNTLRPDQVCLMTLNPVFRDYIDNVLPDLGESNPLTITWQEFLDMTGAPFRDEEYDSTRSDSLDRISDMLPTLEPQAEDFYDIRQKDSVIMTREEILSYIRKFRQFPMGSRLIQNATEELELRAKSVLKNNAIDNNEDTTQSTARSEQSEDNRIENDFGGALKQIRHCSFVNAAHVAQRILGTENITASEWLYTRMLLTGMCDRNMKYVMIDEIQDYTMAQLMVFSSFFPNARFMLLGDEYQAIREGTLTFSDLESFASAAGKKYVELPLLTSYRSSPEITEMFASLLPPEKEMLVSSVKRPGEKVLIKSCGSREYISELKTTIEEYREKSGLTAVICRDQFSLEKISAALSDALVMGDDAPIVVSGSDPLPKSGTLIIELALAKGLEFDQVILPDADSETYPDDELGKHCLYTAMSRATRNLAIFR